MYLKQYNSQLGAVFPTRGYLAISGNILVTTVGCVEGWDTAAKHVMCLPHNRIIWFKMSVVMVHVRYLA